MMGKKELKPMFLALRSKIWFENENGSYIRLQVTLKLTECQKNLHSYFEA